MTSVLDQKSSANSFWERIEPTISNYFEILIGDLLKGIFAETDPTFDVDRVFSHIQQIFLRFWKSIIVKGYREKEFPFGEDRFLTQIHQYLGRNLNVPVYMQEIIINMVGNVSVELLNLFTSQNANLDAGTLPFQLNQAHLIQLNQFLNNYLLVQYFDHVILGQVLKTLLYHERVSFAQIQEIRVDLIDLFKQFLENEVDFEEIAQYTRNLRNTLQLSSLVNIYLENIISSFLLSLSQTYTSDEWGDFLTFCKNRLNQFKKLTKTTLILSEDSKSFQEVLDWVEEQISSLFDPHLTTNAIIETIHSETHQIFQNLILQHQELNFIENQIHSLVKELKNKDANLDFLVLFENLVFSLVKYISYYLEKDPGLIDFHRVVAISKQKNRIGDEEFYI